MNKYLKALIVSNGVIIVLVVAILFQYQQTLQLIGQIKSLEESCPHPITEIQGVLREKYLGKIVTVEGYLAIIAGKYPILVQNYDLLALNMPMPEDLFLPLSQLDINQTQDLEGALLHVEGTLIESEENVMLEVDPEDFPRRVIHLRTIKMAYMYDHLEVLEIIQTKVRFHDNRAVLISGGVNNFNAYIRYWNDLKKMYSILVDCYGYFPDQITVIYKDGTGEDNDMPVHYSATINNVANVFTDLAGDITNQDTLFVFTTNHGGGFHPTDPDHSIFNYGVIDINGDEPEAGYNEQTYGIDFDNDGDTLDIVQIDEVLNLYYNEMLLDDDLDNLLDQINSDTTIIVMEQCFSGGFIHDLSGNNRIILTACHEEEFSHATDTREEGNFDEFVFHFMDAVNTTVLVADANNDGNISMVEAFNYASQNDSQDEIPHYDDNGDQVGHEAPIPNDGDGAVGNNAFL